MNRFRILIAALALGFASAADAAPYQPVPPAAPQVLVNVQANCNAVGQDLAQRNGGTLAKASLEQRGGRAVCVIVVLIPARDGQRPRREEFVVPQ